MTETLMKPVLGVLDAEGHVVRVVPMPCGVETLMEAFAAAPADARIKDSLAKGWVVFERETHV